MVNRELDDQGTKADAPKLASNARPGEQADQSDAKRSWYARLKDGVHRFFR
jgi:hypothetical protein